jgi:hypothetical protein
MLLADDKADPFATISRVSSAELREALRADYAARTGRRFGGSSGTWAEAAMRAWSSAWQTTQALGAAS